MEWNGTQAKRCQLERKGSLRTEGNAKARPGAGGSGDQGQGLGTAGILWKPRACICFPHTPGSTAWRGADAGQQATRCSGALDVPGLAPGGTGAELILPF